MECLEEFKMGLDKIVATKKLSFKGQAMNGVEVGVHPARARMADRIGSALQIVREHESKDPVIAGKVVRDWNVFRKIKETDPEVAGMLLMDCLQKSLNAPTRVAKELDKLGVKELTTKSDFPAEVLDTIEKYHLGLQEIETGYQDIFDIRDFTGTKRNGFKIRDVTSGLTFRKVPVGDTLDVYGMSGTEVEITFDRYGGALGWDKTWFDDEEYWTIDDTAQEFRAKWFKDVAETYYALIEAVAGIDVTWQAAPDAIASATAGYQVQRDVATMNLAVFEILDALKTAGMGVSPNETFLLLAPTALKLRVDRALSSKYSLQNTGMGLTEVAYNIKPIYSQLLSATDYYWVCLPKRKLKGGNRMNLTVLTDMDILAYTEVTAAWGRYGAGIGENDQLRKCATA